MTDISGKSQFDKLAMNVIAKFGAPYYPCFSLIT